VKDKDHRLLEEAWKQVYVEEPNMSPEEAHEAHGKGETLMVTTADGTEFIVDPSVDDEVVQDPQNGLVFKGTDPDGGEVEARGEDISMIKSLSDKESIRGFDPNKSHEAQFTGDPAMAQFGKPTADESVEKETCNPCAAMARKHDHDHDDDDDEESKVKAIIIKRIKGISPESTQVSEGEGNCPPGYYWCTKSKKCKKKSDDEHDDDMRAANAQTAAMAGMPESNQVEEDKEDKEDKEDTKSSTGTLWSSKGPGFKPKGGGVKYGQAVDDGKKAWAGLKKMGSALFGKKQ